ncbi:MAG: hypothetical protein JWM25_717, partial [Thermoleophilia bacterium]|nr:hypothetical protein [Thermoleophilia bacterium]
MGARRAFAIAMTVLAVLLGAAMSAPLATAANFPTTAGPNYQDADLLIGAPTFTEQVFGSSTAKSLYGMYSPHGVSVDGSGSVYAVDTYMNRILRWANPTASGQAFDMVLHKDASASPSIQSAWTVSSPGGGATDSNLPEGISVSGDGATLKIAFADRYNGRVGLYATAEASLVQGQNHALTLGTGTPAAATHLNGTADVWTDGTRLAVADTGNNRVLLWNTWPTVNNQPADIVLGQGGYGLSNVCPNRSAYVAGACNPAISPTASSLYGPKGVHFDTTNNMLFVVDEYNNRVLSWNAWPTTDGQAADNVIGQAVMTTNASGCNSTNLKGPLSVSTYGAGASQKIAISMDDYHRVVIVSGFAGLPSNGPTFTSVLGQNAMTGADCATNRGFINAGRLATGIASDKSLREPAQVEFDGTGRLWVADAENHRVLRFPTLTTNTAADLVLGHTTMTNSNPLDTVNEPFIPKSSSRNNVALAPSGVLVETNNVEEAARIWTAAPTTNNELFARRWGQPDRGSSGSAGPNFQIAPTNVIREAAGVWTDGTKLLITDFGNHRVLGWGT